MPAVLGAVAIGRVVLVPAATVAQDVRVHRHSAPAFTFEYPPAFGEPVRGSDDGFEDRRAALRFDRQGLDVVLTSGRVLVDHQAVSGLHDHFALQVLPERPRAQLLTVLPPLDAATFCAQLAAADHVTGLTLPPDVQSMARMADTMQRHSPRVETCERRGTIVRFSRRAQAVAGSAATETSVFGAVRFLDGPFSSFQVIGRSAASPDAAMLASLERIVESFVASGPAAIRLPDPSTALARGVTREPDIQPELPARFTADP
jgi:hypothetical protein